jgi:hypothetical protein
MKREAHLKGILRISQKHHLSVFPIKEPSLKVPYMKSPLGGDAGNAVPLQAWSGPEGSRN